MAAYEQWLRYAPEKESGDDELYLTCPDPSYGEEAVAYRRAFRLSGDSMDGTGSLRNLTDAEAWLKESAFYADPGSVITNGWVHATQLICIRRSDGKMVGAIHVRHALSEYLADFGGHVGYSVHPEERRKGYARWMLAHVLPYCRSIGISSVMLTCNDDNEGSRRTILSCGGIFQRRVFEPNDKVWMEVYHIG